ncbi:MAG: hypothetical protein AAF466_02190 [Bacteroidota bacterium]
MDTDKLFMRLGIMQTKEFKTEIAMKSKRVEPFVAKVKDFLYDEDDTKVVFVRCEETVFPDDSEENSAEEYTTYIKNIKSVDRYHEKKSE